MDICKNEMDICTRMGYASRSALWNHVKYENKLGKIDIARTRN